MHLIFNFYNLVASAGIEKISEIGKHGGIMDILTFYWLFNQIGHFDKLNALSCDGKLTYL